MSRFTAVRDFVVAQLSTIPGYSVKLVPASKAAEIRPDTGKYPGFTVAMDELERVPGEDKANAGTLRRTYRIPFFIQVWGSSDGKKFGDAYDEALAGAELALDALDGKTPNLGMPSNTTRTHLVCGDIGERKVDAGLVVLLFPVSCTVSWPTNITFQG